MRHDNGLVTARPLAVPLPRPPLSCHPDSRSSIPESLPRGAVHEDRRLHQAGPRHGVALHRSAPIGKSVDEAGLKFDMSDFDGYALEAALQLNEKQGPGETVVICSAPTSCRRRSARR